MLPRWFTPELEIDLCGHATLATAHVLFTEYEEDVASLHFHTRFAGNLTVEKETDGRYTLEFPQRRGQRVERLPEDIRAALKKEPVEVIKARDYVLIYETEGK